MRYGPVVAVESTSTWNPARCPASSARTGLTGFDAPALQAHLPAGTTFQDFFAAAELNPLASLITGTVCGVRVETIEDPLMQKIRYLGELVDELAKGRPMATILRTPVG